MEIHSDPPPGAIPEESLFRGTKWVVFEPNDEPLWAQIRMNVTSFMHDLFRQGASREARRRAYLVKCDSEINTQIEIDRGIVISWLLRAAEAGGVRDLQIQQLVDKRPRRRMPWLSLQNNLCASIHIRASSSG